MCVYIYECTLKMDIFLKMLSFSSKFTKDEVYLGIYVAQRHADN